MITRSQFYTEDFIRRQRPEFGRHWTRRAVFVNPWFVNIGSGWNWCRMVPGASFVIRAFTFHVWSVMSSCEGSTNIGYLVTSPDDSIAREIGNMECDVGMYLEETASFVLVT